MRGSMAIGSDIKTSRVTAATPAIAVRWRREEATAPVTQLSGRPLVRGSLPEGARLGALRGLSAAIEAAGRFRSHVWHPPTHYGHPARADPMRSAIVPSPAIEPSIGVEDLVVHHAEKHLGQIRRDVAQYAVRS